MSSLWSITLAKQKEHYMKGQLNMCGLSKTALFTNISTTALVFNICLILHLCIRHFLRHQHLFKTEKSDLRTTRTNIVHDNTEIIDRHKK